MNPTFVRRRSAERAGLKWLGSPVLTHGGLLTEVESWIPTFERRVFGAEQHGEDLVRLNERLDTIVRLPFREDDWCVPVGVVSKNYALVQHTAVLRAAIDGLVSAGMEPGNLFT